VKSSRLNITSLWKILLVLTISLTITIFPGGTVLAQNEEEPTLTGSWKSDFFLDPDDTDRLIDYNSALDLDYSLTSFTLGSTTRFDNTNGSDGLVSQAFEADGRLGLFDISSDVAFDPDENRLDYWLTETEFTFAGATIETIFLMEHVAISGYTPPFPGKFGAGAELSLQAAGNNGISVDIQNRFGLRESEAEILGVESGSGFDIDLVQYDADGNLLPRSEVLRSTNNFHYVNTVAEIGLQSLGCCTFDSETKFSRENGFEYALFEFPIQLANFPLTIDTELKFTPQTKSVVLDPELDVSFDCFTVYLDMLEDGSTETIYRPEVEGFELRQLPVGPVKVSSITSLNGDLYRNYGTSNLRLRSYEYLIDPDKPSNYILTPYDEIISLETRSIGEEKYPTYDLGLDVYFDMSGSESLFDVSLVTVNARNSLSSDLDLGTGVSFDPEDGPTEIFFELDVYF